MKTLKHIFQLNLSPKEIVWSKIILASVILPIFLFYITSLDFVSTIIMRASAEGIVPPAPKALDMQALSDTGYSDSDNITNNVNPIFDVSGVADEDRYRIYWCFPTNCDDPSDWQFWGTGGNGTNKTWAASGFSANQTYRFALTAVDPLGNESELSPYLQWTIDTTAPTGVAISNPAAGETLKGISYSVLAKTTSPLSSVYGIEIYHVAATDTLICMDSDSSDEFRCDWEISALADGNHQLYAIAYDQAGNFAKSETINVVIDNTAPILTLATTKDMDNNDKIDAIELVFNENIIHTTSGSKVTPDWDVDGYSGVSIESLDGDYILVLGFNEGMDFDSGNKPNISYAKNLTDIFSDEAGNQIEVIMFNSTLDGASPALLAAETQDNNGNGQIDAIQLTFSENIGDSYLNSGMADGWDIDGYNGEAIGTGKDTDDNILVLRINESGSYDADETPFINYNMSSPGDLASTHDLAGNELETITARATLDKAAPTAPIATPAGGDYYSDQTVSLSSVEAGVEIRYTTDGTIPTASHGTVYAGTILIEVDTELKAIAVDLAGNVSPIRKETYAIAPIISAEASGSVSANAVTITWTTDDPATSRVVYDTVSHPVLGTAPNYGYAQSTVEDAAKVISHSVTITGLVDGTTYYYRVVSHGSPEAVGSEESFTTADESGPDNVKNFEGEYRLTTKDVRLSWDADDDDIAKVYIYRGTSRNFTVNSGSRIAINDDDDERYIDDNITAGKTYYYKAVTRDEAGNNSDAEVIKIEIPADETVAAVSTSLGTETVPEGTALGVETVAKEQPPEAVAEEPQDNEILVKETLGGEESPEVLGVEKQTGQPSIWSQWWFWLILLVVVSFPTWLLFKKDPVE